MEFCSIYRIRIEFCSIISHIICFCGGMSPILHGSFVKRALYLMVKRALYLTFVKRVLYLMVLLGFPKEWAPSYMALLWKEPYKMPYISWFFWGSQLRGRRWSNWCAVCIRTWKRKRTMLHEIERELCYFRGKSPIYICITKRKRRWLCSMTFSREEPCIYLCYITCLL